MRDAIADAFALHPVAAGSVPWCWGPAFADPADMVAVSASAPITAAAPRATRAFAVLRFTRKVGALF
ncbi:hypothetical protein [Streptomyces sp. QTS52]